MTMNKILISILLTMATLWSCSNNGNTTAANKETKVSDSTLCQFKNIKVNKMFACRDEVQDTLYFDNNFTAFWPEIINGKPCTELQQALLRAMTDSAELNQLDLAIECLLNPTNYTEHDSKSLIPVKSVKDDENKLSTSEINVKMESMTDRLLTYHLGTYSYMAGAAHGIYANNYVTYDLKTKDVIRNGLLLGIARLPMSVGIRLLHCVPAVIGGLLIYFWSPWYGMLILFAYYFLIGFALSRFITASYTNAVFDRFINPRIEGAKVNQGIHQPEEDDEDDIAEGETDD